MNLKKCLKVLVASLILLCTFNVFAVSTKAANPYLPLWEYIPDGEPYVFEDPENPGKYRAYIYGSHDTRRTEYCGYDIVVWSAPVEDLNNWRYEGVAFESVVNGVADVLFAPDIAEKIEEDGTKTYYLYPNNQAGGRNSMVAKSDSPVGPFEVINFRKGSKTSTEGVIGFDPAVFVDDDGRVYGYWGFQNSFAAELDPETMTTVKPGTQVINGMISNCNEEGDFRFFEASSMRKIKDKYIFVYSRKTHEGEFGLPATNFSLAYAYGDSPLGPWTYGGTLVDARIREKGMDGNVITVGQSWGNTHGSILEINGQWYVFYHRQTNNSMYSRQAVVSPIEVEVIEGKGGKVTISEAEVTSEGFEIHGLNPYTNYSAGITCWYTGGSYIKATYDREVNSNPVVNNSNGSIVGYKYFNFDLLENKDKVKLLVNLIPKGKDATIDIMMDSPWSSRGGVLLGSINISKDDARVFMVKEAKLTNLDEVKGKHAIFFVFHSNTGGELCELHNFKFCNLDDISSESLEIEAKQYISNEKVMAFIDAIGTVEYNDKSKALIDQANKAYQILTEAQKKNITNSSKLIEAEKEYNGLKNQMLIDAGKNYEGLIVTNGGFEFGTEGWAVNNTATIQSEGRHAYSGSRSMLISDRTSTSSGIMQDVTGKITFDVKYHVSAKIKYTEGVDNRTFQISIKNGLGNDVQVMVSGNIKKGDWGTIEGEYTLPSNIDLSSNIIIIETSPVESPTKDNDLMDFYVDDIIIAKVDDINAANDVIELIDDIGIVKDNDTSKGLIDTARRAYDNLSETQKNLVSNRSKLYGAENTYKAVAKKKDGSKAENINDESRNLEEENSDINEESQSLDEDSQDINDESQDKKESFSNKKGNPYILVALIGIVIILVGGGLVIYKKKK
ncbi:MAG: family 43 glycosylhydrolase [Clostridiales bacterium]|nr:family 43 glycosylhydrolase [Clostridiales bacterium]